MGIKRESGNSILEMVMFIPIAILFGILALDAAFSVTDKAVIADAVRSGLGDYKVARQTENIAIFKDGTDLVSYTNDTPEVNEEFLHFLAGKIFKNIADTRKEPEQKLLETIQVDVHAVLARIDSSTGAYRGFDIQKSVSYGGNNIQQNAATNFLHGKDLIQKTLSSYNVDGISPFAAKNMATNSPIIAAYGGGSAKYHDYAVIIYADAVVLTRNTNTALRKIFYGTYNTQQYSHFVKL